MFGVCGVASTVCVVLHGSMSGWLHVVLCCGMRVVCIAVVRTPYLPSCAVWYVALPAAV
jgi:hypothetical protein